MSLTLFTDSALFPTLAWLGTALSSGLLASGHCVAMCGGIALSIEQTRLTQTPPEQSTRLMATTSRNLRHSINMPVWLHHWLHRLLPHLCRITLYALMGFIIHWLTKHVLLTQLSDKTAVLNSTFTFLASLTLPRWLPALTLLAGALLLSGLFTKQRQHACCGAACKQKIVKAPQALKNRSTHSSPHRSTHNLAHSSTHKAHKIPVRNITSPMITQTRAPLIIRCLKWGWGLLPCPMVIAMLLISTNAPNALMAACFMFLYGLGSLPALLGISLLTKYATYRIAHWLPAMKNIRQQLMPAVFFIGSVWTLSHSWLMQHEPAAHNATHTSTNNTAQQTVARETHATMGLTPASNTVFGNLDPMKSLCRPRDNGTTTQTLNTGS